VVDFYLDCGATGLTILGEATKLTAEESRRFAKTVLARVAGRVPVVLGASSPGFAPMRELTESVMAMGASGVMIAPHWQWRWPLFAGGTHARRGRCHDRICLP